MRKHLLQIAIIMVLLWILAGCINDGNKIKTATTNGLDVTKTAYTEYETQLHTHPTNQPNGANGCKDLIFSMPYFHVTGIEGLIIRPESLKQVKTPDIRELYGIFSIISENTLDLSDVWVNGYRGLMVSKDELGKLGLFTFGIEPEIALHRVPDTFFYLPDIFSENLRLFNTEEWVKTTDNGYATSDSGVINNANIDQIPQESEIILFDDINNIAATLTVNNDGIVLDTMVQVPSDYNLSDYAVEIAYDNIAVLSSNKDNNLHIINTDNFTLIESKAMYEWETLYGCYDRIYSADGSNDRYYCLYQINRTINRIRLYDINNDITLREFDINSLPIKGKLVDLFSDREGTTVFIYESDQAPVNIYLYDFSNKQLWELSCRFPERDESVKKIQKIDDMYFYYVWEGEYGYMRRVATAFCRQSKEKKIFLDIENELHEDWIDFKLIDSNVIFLK